MLRFVLRYAIVVLLFAATALTQVNPDLEQGMKPYGAYHGGNLDHIDLSNGNLVFHATLLSYPQRGSLAYPLELQYNNEKFTIFDFPCASPLKYSDCQHVAVFGPPWVHTTNSVGNRVFTGFQALPTVVANASSPGSNTGLSFNGSPIYVQAYSVRTSDGSLRQPVTTNGKAAMGGSAYAMAGNYLLDRNGTSPRKSILRAEC
ncbi:MAG TPA: hypothetical protein VFP71_06845 [Candidatus Angelobacter sp.]|nr:hypothetical protein [Candidatus Angelobacter sp.]